MGCFACGGSAVATPGNSDMRTAIERQNLRDMSQAYTISRSLTTDRLATMRACAVIAPNNDRRSSATRRHASQILAAAAAPKDGSRGPHWRRDGGRALPW